MIYLIYMSELSIIGLNSLSELSIIRLNSLSELSIIRLNSATPTTAVAPTLFTMRHRAQKCSLQYTHHTIIIPAVAPLDIVRLCYSQHNG